MTELPGGPDLLATASQVLKDRILPALQGDARRDLLMALNAMGITQRQLNDLIEDASSSVSASISEVASTKHRQSDYATLAGLIRSRKLPQNADSKARLHERLRELARKRLVVSNPKVLR